MNSSRSLWFLLLVCLMFTGPGRTMAGSFTMRSFPGDDFNFSQQPSNTLVGTAPAHPHGAVGTSGILAVTNYRLTYWPKNPDAVNPVRQWSTPLARPGNTGFSTFFRKNVINPRVLWDAINKRFVVAAQEFPLTNSVIHYAVAKVEHPNLEPLANGGLQWLFFSQSTNRRVELDSDFHQNIFLLGGKTWDCGIDASNFYFTVGLHVIVESGSGDAFQSGIYYGKRMYAAGLQDLYNGRTVEPRVFTDFTGDLVNEPATALASPARSAASATRFFQTGIFNDSDTFAEGDFYLRLHVYDDLTGSFRHDHDDIEIDRLALPSAVRMPGGGQMALDEDYRVASAASVKEDFLDRVWSAVVQGHEDGDHHAVVRVIRVDTLDGGKSELGFDRFFDGGEKVSTFAPALSANNQGDVCVVFTRCSATQYPTTYYSIIRSNGEVGPEVELSKATTTPPEYLEWGPTAAVIPDPVDGTFWINTQTMLAGSDRWGTQWTQVSPYPILITRQPPDGTDYDSLLDVDDSVITTSGNLGQPVTFSMDVEGGTSALVFEWLRNNAPLPANPRYAIRQEPLPNGKPGARAFLTINGGVYSDEGDYQVTVHETDLKDVKLKSRTVRLQFPAQPEWSLVHQTPLAEAKTNNLGPVLIGDGSMAYDAFRKVTVLFGGTQYLHRPALESPLATVSDGTWEWNGRAWTLKILPLSPPGRKHHTLVYDSQRRKMVLFGGRSSNDVLLRDVWEYDGTIWVDRTPTVPPVAWPAGREQHAACYDSLRRRMLVLDGINNTNGGAARDFWQWDGDAGTWSESPGPGSVYFKQRRTMVFDEGRGVAVVFGPFYPSLTNFTLLKQVWEWDGGSWSAKQPNGIPEALFAVGATAQLAAYDPFKKEIFLQGTLQDFSGSTTVGLWWNGRRFRKLPVTGSFTAGTYFPGQFLHPNQMSSLAGLVFDSARRAFVHLGAQSGSVAATSEIRFPDAPAFFLQILPVQVALGGTLTWTLSNTAPARYGLSVPPLPITYQWYLNNQPLTDGPRTTGANTSTLTVTGMTAADFGNYRLEVKDSLGKSTSSGAAVAVQLAAAKTLSIAGTTPGLGISLAWNMAEERLERSTDLQHWVPVPGAVSPYAVYFQQAPGAYFRIVPLAP